MSQRFQRNQIYAILLLIREWAGEDESMAGMSGWRLSLLFCRSVTHAYPQINSSLGVR